MKSEYTSLQLDLLRSYSFRRDMGPGQLAREGPYFLHSPPQFFLEYENPPIFHRFQKSLLEFGHRLYSSGFSF